jgi:hypothetical protein
MKRKPFFSEEKNQKTFAPAPAGKVGARADRSGISPKAKVFWFFSAEKNCFLTALFLLSTFSHGH